MKKWMLCCVCLFATLSLLAQETPIVRTKYGMIEGINESGVLVFKGIPFAQPPVGNNRWKEPQQLSPWKGILKADKYGDDPMQGNPFGDMGFGADKKSEDCLYLNVWTPAKTMKEKLPVLIYFNGGGLIAGSGSEPRYAGLSMARHGIVSITANYREGVFGFFAHPELSKESTYQGSGNYGFMDQVAAIKWVYENIELFGGDPHNITIAGESAGSMSVSALLVSPLTQGLVSKVIASSGSVCGRPFASLYDAEMQGVDFLSRIKAKNIEEARAMSAEDLLHNSQQNALPMACVDGYVFKEAPEEIYRKGNQPKVPLLVGRNSMEMTPELYLQGKSPTLDNLRFIVMKEYGSKTDEVLKLYDLQSDKDVLGKPGVDFASDLFISYGTWLFGYLHAKTSGMPVYRYYYTHPRPMMKNKNLVAGLAGGVINKFDTAIVKEAVGFQGAVHSADIEYAMGTLPTNRVYDWEPEDFIVSEQFIRYYANFIKNGNPNGLGLIDWSPITTDEYSPQLILDVHSRQEINVKWERRYLKLMKLKESSIK